MKHARHRTLAVFLPEALPHGRASDVEINRQLTQAVLTQLPPWFAVVAAGATIAVAIAASATTTSITTTATVTTAASMSAAWTAIGAGARFIHSHATTTVLFVVQLID